MELNNVLVDVCQSINCINIYCQDSLNKYIHKETQRTRLQHKHGTSHGL